MVFSCRSFRITSSLTYTHAHTQGEAQKIDKIMEVFALEYFKHNMGTSPVKSEDAAYMLSFAIMMLHTSLHNPSVRMRTSKKQWVSMNRGRCVCV